jgi:hypothetical protein
VSERWLPVVGYESLYEVSDLGRVRSVVRLDCRRVPRGGHEMTQRLNPKGYARVSLTKNAQMKSVSVHKLVLEAFVGPRPEGHEGCHGPIGNSDNGLHNLRWGTPTENNRDRRRNGTLPIGEKHPQAKITEVVARQIKARLKGDPMSRIVAAEFGVSKHIVDAIRSGRSWGHL